MFSTTTVPRIGIDARLLAYRKGGIAEYTRQLIFALAELDHESNYTIIHRLGDKQSYLPAANFQRVGALTPAHHRLERTALSLELLPRRLDLMHSPDFIPPRRAARRHVITIHDLHFLHYPHFQTRASLRYYRDQIAAAVRRADHIFAQTEGTRQEIMASLDVPPEKITVHLLGVHATFQPLPTERVDQILAPYALPEAYILFVGTIEPRKNIPGLVRAYEILKSQRPDVPHLVLGGQRGWHADEALSAIQNSSARASIHWIDDVPFEALPALYCGATVFVLPSFHEGFGMPAIEAMACGTPVVVSARGSLPEVVGSYGVFVEPDQPDSITSGIERLLDDSALYQQLTQDGLSHARGYSWGRTARIALGVYRQILGLQT